MKPFVSIVVPCLNEIAYIRPMLDSLLDNDYPRERLEVLIVDGMSDDGTRSVLAEYADRYPFIHMLDNPRRTAAPAMNLGIARARGDVIMRMDVHATYPPNYIADLVAALECTGADCVGAVWSAQPGAATVIARAIAAALSQAFGIGNSRYRLGTDRLRDVNTIGVGCYRRAVFERFGLFDEELVRSQDAEFTFRLRRGGGRAVLVPGVVVNYYTRDSLSKLWRMFADYGYYKPLVALKIGRIMTARQLAPALFIVSVGLALLLAPLSFAARVALAVGLGAYAGADLVAAALVARRRGAGVALASLVVFPVIHLAFGIGYLRGLVDFVIRRRRPLPIVSLSR